MNLPFLTKSPALGGQLKRRIEDFQVEEVLENGEACRIEQLHISSSKAGVDVPPLPKTRGTDQLHVHMEKFNIETTFAIRTLARGIGTSIKRIGYAGLKDKRGITCQRISIWQPNVEKIKKFSVRGIALHHASWSTKRIELGDLRGNRFRITIRDIPFSIEETREKIVRFATQLVQGVPNYYGEQRFGGYRDITHEVGKMLLENKIEEAIMHYLSKESAHEEEEIRVARKKLAETHDFKAALNEFPDKFHFEKIMLNHLVQFPADFAGAFQCLPEKTRYLFTHAYQSHIFNLIIAERVRRGLFYPMEGDVLDNGIPTAPLPGIKTIISTGIPGEIEREVFAKEKITPELFSQPKLKELASWGMRKKMRLNVQHFQLHEVSADELYEGKTKASVSFQLEKGTYATTVLRELMKSETTEQKIE